MSFLSNKPQEILVDILMDISYTIFKATTNADLGREDLQTKFILGERYPQWKRRET